MLAGRLFACSLQAHEKQNTTALQSAPCPKGQTIPASKKQAYRFSTGVQLDSGAHDPQPGAEV